MRVVSWNVNGIRACVRHGFVDFVDRSGADCDVYDLAGQ